MAKKKGFTLVELLAVIVILAVILVIAVPQIMNVITESRKGALISSAKLIASSAETKKVSNDTLGIEGEITCKDVSNYTDEDYDSCTITFDENGKAQVTIVGKGKFEGMSVCSGTKENAEVSSECTIATDAACFSYGELVSNFDINEEVCKEYTSDWGLSDEESTIYCTGGNIDGWSLKSDINEGWVSASELETEGVISNVQSGMGITGYSDECPKDVVIPSKIDNETIAIIGDGAFSSNQLTSVTIPDSVTYIEAWAFGGNQLTSVIIPNNVTTIGEWAFVYNQLTSVTIPNNVTSIGDGAFNGNNLSDSDAYIYKRNSDGSSDNTYVVSYGGAEKNITIPDSVITIGDYAFSDNQLTSVTIPNNVTSIGDSAFYNNYLTNVTIPNSVINMGWGAFYFNDLTSVIIPNNVTSIGDYAFSANQLTSVIIPDSVTYIGKGTFEGNDLTSVTVPDSVTAIGSRAFIGNALTSVTIGNSVTTIGGEAFSGNQLTRVTIPNSVTDIGQSAFYKDSSSNSSLTSIINTTGRSFDWNYIITGTSGESSETGTYNGVNVTTE